MSSRFIQLLSHTPTAGGTARLLALDDDGVVWVYKAGTGWRRWTEQRQGGVGQPDEP